MSYLIFFVLFVFVPALLAAGSLQLRSKRLPSRRKWLYRHWVGTAILAVIALVWTSPWDQAIIERGVWSYGEGRVLGTIGLVPLEEYAFMFTMPFFNAALIGIYLVQRRVQATRWRESQKPARTQALLFYAALWLLALVAFQFEPLYYLSITLLWFLPPLAIQSVFDPGTLRRHWFILAAGTLIPTVYFSIVDAYAIRDGIWTIHDSTRSGIDLFGLPMEEAFFFLITSLLLARGIVLWHSLFERRQA
jgi:lycopene cyclase domain-containing protein